MVEAIKAMRTAPVGIQAHRFFVAKKFAQGFPMTPRNTGTATQTATVAKPMSVAVNERKE